MGCLKLKVVAIIQARMGSTRLPGKVLMKLGSQEVLGWVVQAARNIFGVDEVVVATSVSKQDDPIEDWCGSNNINIYRGSELDVLSRYWKTSVSESADVVMRLTADCPFLDSNVCATVLSLFKAEGADYASNVSPANWPDGLDCEVMKASCLRDADREASLKIEREHVTPFIQYNRNRYKVVSISVNAESS